jgi:streptogrisin D
MRRSHVLLWLACTVVGHSAAARKARLKGTAVGLALVSLASLILVSPANAKPQVEPPSPGINPDPQSIDGMDPALLATMRKQATLEPAATILTEAAAKIPGSGLASLAFEGDGLVVYWKGAMPASMVAAMTAARKFGPVSIRSAPYSKAELEAEAAKIDAAAEAGSNIASIVLKYDGSGLLVEQMRPATAAAAQARAGRALPTAATIVGSVHATVPVQVTMAQATYEFLSCPSTGCTRRDDTSPWNSGDYPGFGVYVPAWDQTYVLTAAHCATWHAGNGDNAYDGAGEFIGRASIVEDWDKDLILIEARGWRLMFDGGPTTRFKKTVHSWGYHVVNELLCQSGARSGTVCGLKTESNNYANWTCDSDGDCFYVHGLIGATQVDGRTAGQHGDSGGPIFSLDGDGVRAKGVLSAGDGAQLLFQDMADVTTSRSGPGSSIWNAAIPLTN